MRLAVVQPTGSDMCTNGNHGDDMCTHGKRYGTTVMTCVSTVCDRSPLQGLYFSLGDGGSHKFERAPRVASGTLQLFGEILQKYFLRVFLSVQTFHARIYKDPQKYSESTPFTTVSVSPQ